MVGAGFEPSKAEPTGLQPVPFDRSGIPPGGGQFSDARVRGMSPGAMSALTIVDTGEHGLDRFADVLSEEQYAEVQEAVGEAQELLDGRVVWNVNSTARGGGVAEMLALAARLRARRGRRRALGRDRGRRRLLRVTKRLHNRLHGAAGDGGPLGDDERATYERALAAQRRRALRRCVAPGDVVILHDPQTAGLIPRAARRRRAR